MRETSKRTGMTRMRIHAAWLHVHHNTFLGKVAAVGIRGVPSQGALVHNNWFVATTPDKAVFSRGNTRVFRNAYGEGKTLQEGEVRWE